MRGSLGPMWGTTTWCRVENVHDVGGHPISLRALCVWRCGCMHQPRMSPCSKKTPSDEKNTRRGRPRPEAARRNGSARGCGTHPRCSTNRQAQRRMGARGEGKNLTARFLDMMHMDARYGCARRGGNTVDYVGDDTWWCRVWKCGCTGRPRGVPPRPLCVEVWM